MRFIHGGYDEVISNRLRYQLIGLTITLLSGILIYHLINARNMKMKSYCSDSLSSNLKHSANMRIPGFKWSAPAYKLYYDKNINRNNVHGIYGCPECHVSSLSCHINWEREELENIRKLWMLSFHSTLIGDTFNYCYSFFIKGECLMCHPTLFDKDNRKMPNYQRL